MAANTAVGSKKYDFIVSDKAIPASDLVVLEVRIKGLDDAIQAERPSFGTFAVENIILEEFK